MNSFTYSAKFQELIARFHRGKEDWPQYQGYIEAHLGGPESRYVEFLTRLVPEIQHHCGPLEGKRVLEFGCGTGAATAALATVCRDVIAFDIGKESVDICRQRIEEHAYQGRVRCLVAPDIAEVAPTLGKFDVILVNSVLEHIPLSIKGLRRRVALTLWELIKPGGFVFISGTPNRLYPYDDHSTQLWFIPWTPAGSEWAYKRAVKKGRHAEAPTHSPGTLGLEEVGAWGATYWGILRYFGGLGVVCLNTVEGHNRHVHYSYPGSKRRQLLEQLLYYTAVKPFRIPMTAFTPYILNLLLQKKEMSDLPPK